MSELTFEQMLEESFKNIHVGDVVEGTVIAVAPEEIAVNIGYKSDGIVSKNEYSNDSSIDLTQAVKVDDTITVKVLKLNDGDGQVVLSHKRVVAEKVSAVLEEAFNNKTPLKATVTEVVKGGLKVVVDEVPVFIPASLATDSFGKKDLSDMAGTEVEFVMSEFNPKKRRYIGDCRTILAEKKAAEREKVLSSINVGDVIEGEVKNVTNFGAFVDIGGADGLLHISEMSWGRIDHPQNVFRRGDKVKVFVKEINGDKIALSAKFEDENPWTDADSKFAIGSVVKGTVARMTDFGAFVNLGNGVDALLHVSQIAREHIEKPSDVLKVGQEIEAEIVDVNVEEKKISLSIKALLPEAPESEEATAEESAE
jgi:small subunit ribosomal protein S1